MPKARTRIIRLRSSQIRYSMRHAGRSTKTTRRLAARPASVALPAVGFSCPNPWALTISRGRRWWRQVGDRIGVGNGDQHRLGRPVAPTADRGKGPVVRPGAGRGDGGAAQVGLEIGGGRRGRRLAAPAQLRRLAGYRDVDI